jgi:GntR family transcriptional regulator
MSPSSILFEIDPSSGLPIYRQLIEQVHALVAGQRLRPGDLLPSVRQVAKAAAVNPMTVSKAYSRLEAEGTVERVRGLGMRISKRPKGIPIGHRRKQFRQLAQRAIARASQLGLTEAQVRDELESLVHDHFQEDAP